MQTDHKLPPASAPDIPADCLPCSECKKWLSTTLFTATQLKRQLGRKCRSCVAEHAVVSIPASTLAGQDLKKKLKILRKREQAQYSRHRQKQKHADHLAAVFAKLLTSYPHLQSAAQLHPSNSSDPLTDSSRQPDLTACYGDPRGLLRAPIDWSTVPIVLHPPGGPSRLRAVCKKQQIECVWAAWQFVVGVRPGATIVDFGCGTGSLALVLAFLLFISLTSYSPAPGVGLPPTPVSVCLGRSTEKRRGARRNESAPRRPHQRHNSRDGHYGVHRRVWRLLRSRSFL